MWNVYILECKDGSLYTGVTTDVKRRFKEHKNKATRYTRSHPPRKITYTENFPTQSQALKREAEIKRLTRKKKLALVAGDFV